LRKRRGASAYYLRERERERNYASNGLNIPPKE